MIHSFLKQANRSAYLSHLWMHAIKSVKRLITISNFTRSGWRNEVVEVDHGVQIPSDG